MSSPAAFSRATAALLSIVMSSAFFRNEKVVSNFLTSVDSLYPGVVVVVMSASRVSNFALSTLASLYSI